MLGRNRNEDAGPGNANDGTSWKVMEKLLADEAGVEHGHEGRVVENQGDTETFQA